MATYAVTIPIAGKLCIDVEAESEDEAIDKAMATELVIEHIEEWEALRIICQGNFFYGCLNEAYAEEI